MKLFHYDSADRARMWAPMASLAAALVISAATDARAQDVGQPPPPPPTAPPPPPPGYERSYDRSPPPRYRQSDDRPLIISDWPDDEPAPSGYHWGKRVRRGPIIGGAILFGVTYLPALLTAAAGTQSDSAYGWLYVPAVGPFLELSNSSTSLASTVLVLDGLAQSAGVALLIWGITSPSPVLVRNRVDSIRVLPVPMALGKGASGLGVVGTF